MDHGAEYHSLKHPGTFRLNAVEALGAQLQNVSGTQDPQIPHGALLIFRIQIGIQTVYGQRRLIPN